MYRHGPSTFAGPVTQSRLWWVFPTSDDSVAAYGPSATSLADCEDIRVDLVERVRREIAAGTYETDEKWEEALDRLFDRLDQE